MDFSFFYWGDWPCPSARTGQTKSQTAMSYNKVKTVPGKISPLLQLCCPIHLCCPLQVESRDSLQNELHNFDASESDLDSHLFLSFIMTLFKILRPRLAPSPLLPQDPLKTLSSSLVFFFFYFILWFAEVEKKGQV